MRVAETNADVEDVAVPDDRPVVPRQSLAHAVVVPPRGVPRRTDRSARLPRHRPQVRVQPLPRVAQVEGGGAAAARHAQQAAQVSIKPQSHRIRSGAPGQMTPGLASWAIDICIIFSGPSNGPALFCWLASVVVCRRCLQRCRRAGPPTAGRVGGRAADTARRASRVTSR